jgi:uncharacterized protein
MSRQTKSSAELAAAVIDSLEFAREERALDGKLPVAALKRLADVVAEPVGELHCRLSGSRRRRDGKPVLVLEVSGTLRLRCQRCLQVMDFPLDVVGGLLPMAAGEPWPDEEDEDWAAGPDEEWDAIEANHEQSVLELVEDEVLLALPIVPKHEACESPVAMEDEHEPSPFAVLAKLKQ